MRRARAINILRRRTRARVRRQNQLKPRRIPHRTRRPRQQHRTRLHRLPQRIKNSRPKLGGFIEEENSMVGLAD